MPSNPFPAFDDYLRNMADHPRRRIDSSEVKPRNVPPSEPETIGAILDRDVVPTLANQKAPAVAGGAK